MVSFECYHDPTLLLLYFEITERISSKVAVPLAHYQLTTQLDMILSLQGTHASCLRKKIAT